MINKTDIVGIQVGRLTVLSFEKTVKIRRRLKHYYSCKCDCGNIALVVRRHLREKSTKSCGCLLNEILKMGPTAGKLLPKGEAGFRRFLKGVKLSAKARNLEFKLSEQEVRSITQSNCFYCDRKPIQKIDGGNPEVSKASTKIHTLYLYNGIDRMDNSKGYTTENSVPCCKTCNRAKLAMPFDEFVDWIGHVYRTISIKSFMDYIVPMEGEVVYKRF